MEIWKPIKDYEGLYEVTSYGNVRSLDREVYQSNGKIAITSPIFIYHYNIIDENTL